MLWVAVESNHAPLSYQESVLTDELATLLNPDPYFTRFKAIIEYTPIFCL